MATVLAPPAAAGVEVVAGGVEAAVVSLLLLPPHAARPSAASAVTARTAEAFFIRTPLVRLGDPTLYRPIPAPEGSRLDAWASPP